MGSGIGISTQDQMASTEEQDRVARFNRLADANDVARPTIKEISLPPGSVDFMQGSVPVVRVVFPERAFFAFDSDVPLPQSQGILDVIADNMKHDVPDAALTILGHTDAVGTDGYNIDLSRRRARAVIRALIERGVNPDQLTEVAIGKRQPIASNATTDGRALNRRVEFLISPAMSANLAAVQQYVVPKSYLSLAKADDVRLRQPDADVKPAQVAMVYRATAKNTKNTSLAPIGGLALSPTQDNAALSTPSDLNVKTIAPENVKLAATMPIAPVHLIPPAEVKPRALGSGVIEF
ncbi:OmpA family protein [Acetobacter syzygii]|nr:OmpA family protein [Acetobacter syzygii]NSL92743.1 OmpA family protein [Acetobacter syzygii]